MWAEQAIFTSLARGGQAGYHVVSRSPGVSEEDVRTLATWAPSHGALIVDSANRTSVNFHPLGDGRHVLSRTCAGPPEYSGRGGRQLYTHALILDPILLQKSGRQPVAIYRHALALGHLLYQPEPAPVLVPLALAGAYGTRSTEEWTRRVRELGWSGLAVLRTRLECGEDVLLHHPGDRVLLAECLLGLLSRELAALPSFSTSLQPSASRPYRISLVG